MDCYLTVFEVSETLLLFVVVIDCWVWDAEHQTLMSQSVLIDHCSLATCSWFCEQMFDINNEKAADMYQNKAVGLLLLISIQKLYYCKLDSMLKSRRIVRSFRSRSSRCQVGCTRVCSWTSLEERPGLRNCCCELVKIVIEDDRPKKCIDQSLGWKNSFAWFADKGIKCWSKPLS